MYLDLTINSYRAVRDVAPMGSMVTAGGTQIRSSKSDAAFLSGEADSKSRDIGDRPTARGARGGGGCGSKFGIVKSGS